MPYKATQIPGKEVADLFGILFKNNKSQIKVCFQKYFRNYISDYTWHNGFQKYTKMKQLEMQAKMRYIQQRVFKYYIEYLYTELNILYEIKINHLIFFLTLFNHSANLV